jgi:hypothetical protein
MTAVIYPRAKAHFLTGGIDLSALNVHAALVNVSGGGTTYTYSATHEFLDDVPSDAIIAASSALANKHIGDDGSFDSDDPTLTAVTGVSVEALILYADTGTTAFLILYQDSGVTGLPLTPDGSDVQIVVDSAGWFTL